MCPRGDIIFAGNRAPVGVPKTPCFLAPAPHLGKISLGGFFAPRVACLQTETWAGLFGAFFLANRIPPGFSPPVWTGKLFGRSPREGGTPFAAKFGKWGQPKVSEPLGQTFLQTPGRKYKREMVPFPGKGRKTPS